MVQSPSWEANWFAASQEIPRISWNPKVHYRTHNLSLSWASLIQSTYPHPTSWRSILILSTHLRLGLPSGLLPSGFPSNTIYTPISSPIRATCPALLINVLAICDEAELYKLICDALMKCDRSMKLTDLPNSLTHDNGTVNLIFNSKSENTISCHVDCLTYVSLKATWAL